MRAGGALLALLALSVVGAASPAGAVSPVTDDCSGHDCDLGCALCLYCSQHLIPLPRAPGSPPAEPPSSWDGQDVAAEPPGAPAREIPHVPW